VDDGSDAKRSAREPGNGRDQDAESPPDVVDGSVNATAGRQVVGTTVGILQPVVERTVPVLGTVAPVVDAVAPVVSPVIGQVAGVAAPVISPVVGIVDPVGDVVGVVGAVGPVIAPVQPIVDPVTDPVSPITDPATGPVTPITDPITGPSDPAFPPSTGGGPGSGTPPPVTVAPAGARNPAAPTTTTVGTLPAVGPAGPSAATTRDQSSAGRHHGPGTDSADAAGTPEVGPTTPTSFDLEPAVVGAGGDHPATGHPADQAAGGSNLPTGSLRMELGSTAPATAPSATGGSGAGASGCQPNAGASAVVPEVMGAPLHFRHALTPNEGSGSGALLASADYRPD
jgi:hypothetical protein